MSSEPTVVDRVTAFTSLWLEVEEGWRPARHLRPLLTAELWDRLRSTPSPLGRRRLDEHGQQQIVRVLVQTTGDRCEAVVLLRDRRGTTALTLALRREEGVWRVADLGRPGASLVQPEAPPPEASAAEPPWHRADDDGPGPAWRVPDGWVRPLAA